MKALVVDGSATLGLLLPDERASDDKRELHALLAAKTPVHVPAHWWAEVTNGVLVAERRKRVTQAAATEILSLFSALEVTTDLEAERRLPSDVALLARQQNLTAYDGAYLELAIRLGAGLATHDRELAEAAVRCGVEVFA